MCNSCSHVSSTRQRELREQFVLSGCVISRVQFVISRKIADAKGETSGRIYNLWYSQRSAKVVGFLWVIRFPPTGKVDRVG